LPILSIGHSARHFSHTVKTPGFGAESITEGTVQEWKVNVGDAVKTGDLIAMIETDKVTVEVNADGDGTVMEIHIPVDGTAEVGAPLCTLGEGAPAAKSTEAAAAAPAASPTGEELIMNTPDFGAESITEGTVQEWKYKVGDYVKKGEIISLIETDKVTVEVAAEDSGTLIEILVDIDGTAIKGEPLCKIVLGGAPPADAAPAAASASAAAAASSAPATPAPAVVSPAVAAEKDGRPERRVKMTRMRKAIAKNLKNAQDSTAMLTTFQEVDMSGLMQLRKEHKESFEAIHGVRLGIMSAFIKASSFALEQIPAINAYIDDKTDEIVYRDFVDISVAAASPKGLVVPVLRNCESMSVAQVEDAMSELARKARAEELTLDDMSGGTFTISNGGVFGSMLGTPIINFAPQSAILGMHATKMRPVVLKSGEIVSRPIMYLALTYDHRLVDGREAVTFLCMVRDQVEDPRRLLLGI
jgi:2-oxoglutarate dehydrogenase E2 component (dihydrolipoamide succinyltransferase)